MIALVTALARVHEIRVAYATALRLQPDDDVRRFRYAVVLAVVAASRVSAADEITQPHPPSSQESPVPPAPPAPEPAPTTLPGDESGRTDPPDEDSTLREIGRGALFVPRVVWNVAMTPVRASIWTYERFGLEDLYYRLFFNKPRTMGLYPTVGYETGFGFTGGGRFVHRDLFGQNEHLAVQAATGGHFRQIYSVSFRTGDRFDRVSLELDAGWERRPHDEFFGIGNGDLVTMAPPTPIDPRIDTTAVSTRYSQDHAKIMAATDVRVVGPVHVRPAGALSTLSFGMSDNDRSAAQIYDPAALVGYGGFRSAYGEVEVRWDDRRRATTFEPSSIYAAGSLAAVFGGRILAVSHTSTYWRYGGDFQHFFRIGEGPRVVSLRLHGEGVTGSVDEVPFTELPRLGGSSYLRGYSLDRFRDRIATVGSLEYQWDLSGFAGASAFVDAGRVYRSVDEMSLDHMRVGFGVAIDAYSQNGFYFVASAASSLDGGLFLNLSFNPVFDLDERVRRK